MSANSKREQLIEKVKTEIAQLTSVKTVTRKIPSGLEDLERYASTQLPLAAVVGKLPRPQKIQGGKRGSGVDCSLVESALEVEVYGYFMDNVTPDTTLSNLADDFFRALNADPWKGGLALRTEVTPDIVGNWDPYVAFKFICKITYTHSLGGI